MTTLESLLNEIIQEISKSIDPLDNRIHELKDLMYESSIGKSEEEVEKARAGLEETTKPLKELISNYKIKISKEYSSKLIKAIELANYQGNDTNPIYSGEIEKYKGMSILHLAAYGFFGDKIEEILPHIRPQDIKRGSGLNLESELMAAIEEKSIVLRDWLLENDSDPMYQKKSGSSALHIACMIKDYETTECLIKRVAEEKGIEAVKEFVNAVNTYGCTPLYDALVMGSSRGTLDNDKMMKFLSLFMENGVELNRGNSGKDTGKYTIFNKVVTSHLLEELDLDRASAVVKMLNSDQDIKIDLKKSEIREFFTNESNMQKILLLEDYDAAQKSVAFNKIKKAMNNLAYSGEREGKIIVNQEGHSTCYEVDQEGLCTNIIYIKEADGTTHYNIQLPDIIISLRSSISSIEGHISQLSQPLLSDIDASEVVPGIEHIDIGDNHIPVEISGHSHYEEATEG
ncbi:hypothetical protein phytr_700 [Candidatus Phycorickettsia trachydisci]|uniref:Uncharacterized protein n=1 Tax=Candidatus Phycorickettsia trachydisci TaxID=2115978 RepID=A0A2P1P6Y8_9RICK|nr:ankyrin repeat domain-containing protein [Candidatus Phycorickettsia trachydisci]AVP87033.1 hypothetical protein phytr_700 [Candidatus Phycorickettsia trachydisci]